MKRLFQLLMITLPLYALAQKNGSDEAVKWRQLNNWDQVIKQAKEENKFIFVDCFTTWCGPCKLMDREVYGTPLVGEFMNQNFVSIRLQMDSTKEDNNQIQMQYQLASSIKKQIGVKVFPTFLFFDKNGVLVHIGTGALQDSNFLKLAVNAKDTTTQYYTLVRNYFKGIKDYTRLKYLSRLAKSLNEDSVAAVVAYDYLNNYLYNHASNEILQRDNLEFIGRYLVGSDEKGFKIFYEKRNLIDQVMKLKDFALNKIVDIVIKENINPFVWPKKGVVNNNPKWDVLEKSIAVKYNSIIATKAILNSRLKWYNQKEDWKNLAKYTVIQIERYGYDISTSLSKTFFNNTIFNVIFMYSDNISELKKAANWMQRLLDSNEPEYIDTYANLLYKMGNRKDAIFWEKKAFDLEVKRSAKTNSSPDAVYLETLQKMQSGKPTWPSK